MSEPFFSLSGLAFQPTGTDEEQVVNIAAAMRIIRAYCFEGGNAQDAQLALGYLEDNAPKVERFCDEIRSTMLLDDFVQSELKEKLCIRAYNALVSRLNGKPV